MDKKALFTSKLLDVFRALALEPSLNFFEKEQVKIATSSRKTLLKVDSDSIIVPGLPLNNSFCKKTSPLKDNFVDINQIESFVSTLSERKSLLRLNHVGFCYLVNSPKAEKQRLIELVQAKGLSLYVEESSDSSVWLYIGDRSEWDDPLVEFVLVEEINDKWKDYWLPHFQIDIDTNLVVEDIESIVSQIFKGEIKPFRMVVTNNYVSVLRVRLGIIGGININLDLGTEGRMPRFHREKLLAEVR